MSLSLIAFHPAIELPSNMKPSVSMSSSITPEAMVRCCHLPLGSVKRRSSQSISSSLIRDRILPALFAIGSCPRFVIPPKAGTQLLHRPTKSRPDLRFREDDEPFDSSLGVTDSSHLS